MSEQIKEIKALIESLEKSQNEMISATVLLEKKYKGTVLQEGLSVATNLMQLESKIDGMICPAAK